MRFGNIVSLCLPLVVLCSLPARPSAVELVKSKAVESYRSMVECGRRSLRRALRLMEEGKEAVFSRVHRIASKIKGGREELVRPGEGLSEEEMGELTKEDIDRLIQEIRKKLAGLLVDNAEEGEQEEGVEKAEEEKEEEKEQEEKTEEKGEL